MKQRMRYLVLVALAASTTVVGACSDDEDSIAVDKGGSAGAAGSKTGGSSAGGSANNAGNNSGGKAGSAAAGTSAMAGTSTMAGTSAMAGAGGAGEGGAGGATDGGADSAGAGGSDGGAAGAGGAGEPALVYKCGSSTLIRKQCSALAAADCTEPIVCSDCIDAMTADREASQLDPPCPACDAKYDAVAQCEVDAFESGDLAFGVQCFGDFADGSDSCYEFLNQAVACEGYVGSDADPHECPATWPPQ